MPNERKDEFLSWRSRLDPMEGIPGQGLDDRELTWARLMDRLRGKPRRRLPVYAIVAACLLLLTIPAARFFHGRSSRKTTPPFVQAAAPATQPDGQREFVSSAAKPLMQPQTPAGRHWKKDDLAGNGHRSGRQTARSANRTPSAQIGLVAVTDALIHTPGAPPAPLVSQLPAAGAAAKKKWKVVDLNELNSGWQPPPGMAYNFPPASLRVGPGKAEPVPAGGIAPPPSSLRIKLSP
ncbi:MAG TPA: hypothetical protein VHE54_10640 [Puia sp.]|nr:hypothetical protein [Puia sp.]